jgi:hypothetical protein
LTLRSPTRSWFSGEVAIERLLVELDRREHESADANAAMSRMSGFGCVDHAHVELRSRLHGRHASRAKGVCCCGCRSIVSKPGPKGTSACACGNALAPEVMI